MPHDFLSDNACNSDNKQFDIKSEQDSGDFTDGSCVGFDVDLDMPGHPPSEISMISEEGCQSDVRVHNKPPKFNINLGDCVDVTFTADSGASCSIIDEKTFTSSLQNYIELTKTEQKIKPYGNAAILPLGKFKCGISSGDKHTSETFFVMPGECGCLLSVGASQKLNLIAIATHTVNNVSDTLLKQNPQILEGIGAHNKCTITLHIDKSVPADATAHRRIPFHTRNKVETELQRLLAEDIIEKVDGPTPWVSPIVVAPKPKNPDKVRIWVDMRRANKAIRRERHPQPTLDDIQTRLNGATVFSTLDLRAGYHQLILDKDSRYITTFSTIGLFRYKRLNFGISSASEVFQKTIEQVINGIPGTMNMSDDIIVFGESQEKHDGALTEVFKRLSKFGLTLNKKKCKSNQSQVQYFGMIFSGQGMQPDPQKIESLFKMSPPATKSEVQSLISMVNYSARFILHYSTVTEPLRRLTHNDTDFVWGEEQQSAFEAIKRHLSDSPVMSYFDINKPTELVVDASPVGLGAILIQRASRGEVNIVAYGSRALTDTEQRYSQIEREALAIAWACEHFHLYTFDAQTLVVHTDHKPLVALLGNPNAKLPLRLARWMLRLQPYHPVIKFQKGSTNPADYLSRHPLSLKSRPIHENIAGEYINFVVTHAVPAALSEEDVLRATLDDPTLDAVKNCTHRTSGTS